MSNPALRSSALLALSAALALASVAGAQSRPTRPKRPAPTPTKKDEKKKKKDKKPDRFFAVHAGQVFTVSGGVLRDVTILSKNGKIVEIGRDLDLPKKTEVLDAKRYRVYPGLVAYNSFGIVGGMPADSTDVYSLEMAIALSTGITTVGAGNTVAKLTWGTLEGHVVGPREMTIRLSIRSSAQRKKLRQALDQVVAYKRKAREYNDARRRGEKPTPLKPLKGKQALFAKLLSGGVWAYAKADSRAELTQLVEIATHYGFRVTLEGGAEAWTIAPQLSRAGFRVIVVPRSRRSEDPTKTQVTGWSIENAAILHKHGVPVTIMSKSAGIGLWGLAGSDLFTLPLEGAFAVRGGLSEAEALKGLTLNPARFMGVSDRVGSIEVGKDCDLVISRGDLLHYETLPEWTVVNGRVAYDKAKDSLLRHVRARDIQGKNLDVPLLWPRTEGSREGMKGE